MKIRNEWMSDKDYFGEDYPNNILLECGVERFKIQKYSLEGRFALIDGDKEERIVVQNHTNPLNQAKYDKKISFDIDSNIHTGSILEFDNKVWLVVSKIFDKLAYKVCSVLECNNTLSFYSPLTSTIHLIPCYIDSNVRLYSMGEQDSRFVSIPDSTIIVRVPNTPITKEIKRNDIFKLSYIDNYKIVDINSVIEPGLIVFKMDWCSEEQILPIYTISILNKTPLQIAQSQSLTLNVAIYKDGELLTSPPTYSFSSSNEEIATTDEHGEITALGLGIVTFAVTLDSDNSVSNSVDVEIIADEVDNFTYTIEGSTDIIKNYSQNYTAEKYNNGVLIEGTEFTFVVIPGTTPINTYTLNVINSDECNITANSATYYITLRAIDNSNNEYVEKQIKLKSLF